MKPLSKRKKTNHSGPTQYSDKEFSAIMADTTHAMPQHKRLLSNLIHKKAVWTISSFIGKSIARPNAILLGAIISFLTTLGTYLLAKNFGYSLSGSESVVGFLVGWAVGTIFDCLSAPFKKR